MDSQGIKNKLQEVLTAEEDVRQHKSQLEHLRRLEKDINAPKSYADLQAEQRAKIDTHKRMYRRAQKIIDNLCVYYKGQQDMEKTRTCKTILTERYLNGKSWPEIAELINYSPRQAQRLHGVALEAAAKATLRRKKA